MTETARLVIAVDSTQVGRADSALQKFGQTTSMVEKQSDSLSSAVMRLAKPLAGVATVAGIKGLIDISDSYGQMADRIRMATSSVEEYAMVQGRLLQSANKTYRPLVEAQELYIRTADAIRSLGYETSDALDITDSFSYLLVTNAASADRASSAVNAYSKAIQTGKVDSEGWQSILAAMPSVVETLADELDKSSNEIRELGITGKLALADLNEGLRRSVEENQRLADGMGTTLNDAIVRAGNNWSAYLGESEKVTGASRLMSGALDAVSENLETVAGIASGVAVAAMARYSVALAQNTTTAVSNYRANQIQAAEELKLAQAQAATTATTLNRARSAFQLTGVTTGLATAVAAHEAAEKRLAAAQTASIGLGRTALGLAGGWVGLAVTAGAVAASFIDWGSNAEEAARQSIALREESNLLTRAVQELDAAQAKQVLQRMEEPYRAAKDEARNYAAQIEYLNIQIDQHPGSAKVDDWRRSLVEAEGNLSTVNGELTKQEAKMRELNARIEQNTANRRENNLVLGETDDAGSKFLAQLQRQADFAGRLTEVQRVNIAIEKGYAGALSESDKQLALSNAAIVDRANAFKVTTKATNEQATAFQALMDRLYPAEAAQRQYNDELDRLKKQLSGDQLAQAINRLNHAIDGADATGPANAIQDYIDELERLEDQLDPVGKATKQYEKDVERLKAAMERGERSPERTKQLLAELETQYKANTAATSEWAKWTEGALDRVDSAFADAWRNIGDGFDSFKKSLTDGFKQMLAELAHMAITKPIIMQFGSMLGIGNGTQGNNGIWGSLLGGSSGSSGGVNWGQMASYGQSLYSAATGWGPAAYAGWQSGGVSGALSGAGNFYGGMLGNAANTVGGWFGGSAAANVGSGAVQGGAGWMLDGAGNVVNTATQSGANAVSSSFGGAGASALNPVMWGIAALLGSHSFYKAGYTLDHKQVADQKLSKIHFAMDPGLATVFDSMMKATEFASEKILQPIFGEKWGNILSLGPLFSGFSNTVNKALFGGAWQTKDYGLALGVDDGEFDSDKFEYRKKKGGLFSSSKKKTIWTELDAETAAALQETYDATEAGVASLFETLSLSVEEGSLAGLQLAREQISTKGKTEEEISQAISEWFGKTAEAMNTELNKVFGTGLDYGLAGMQAFVGNLQGVNEVIRYLDVTMYDMSVSGGKLAESLSAAAGGLDALAANSQTYYGAFFTDAEKVEDTIDSITRAFESADVTLAGSRAEYRAMVEDIDLTTEAGQEMFATLMALSGQAATYYSTLEQQLMGAANSAYASLQRSIANQQREIQQQASSATASINALTGISNALDAALKKLRGTSDDAVRSLRAQAVMTLNSALVTARAGQSLAGFAGMQDALDVASQMDTALYASLVDFEREQGRTANLIAELEKVNGKQLTAEQKLLEKYDAQLAALDKQLTFAQSQLDALNGIDNSVMGVAAAVAAMNASVVAALVSLPKGAAQANTPTNNRAIVDSIYQSVLGRGTQGDEAGAAFWAKALQNGTATYQDIATSIAKGAISNAGESAGGKKSAEEYLKGLGIPGFATGGNHLGGAAIVGEKGPELMVTGPARIYSNSQTAAMLNGGDTAAAIGSLQQSVERQGDALRSIAKHTMQTANRVEFLERWDYDGLPNERDAA